MSLPTSNAAPPASLARAAAPLSAVLAFTFINSIGSLVIYQGIFFLAKHEYGFTTTMNFGLALLFGLMYIPAACLVGPTLRRLGRSGISPRAMLGFIMVGMACLCWLPWVVVHLQGDAGAGKPAWPIWLAVGLYSPLAGAMWPIIESFLAGGRTESELRAAIGKFNIAWSSAIVLTLMAIGPILESHALAVLQGLGLVHLSCLGVIAFFPPIPGRHAEHHAAAPLHYRQLLGVLRLLLPTSFMFISTLSPYIPGALERLDVPIQWGTLIASTWYGARVLTFFTMERWHGWHGRWSTPVGGILILLASFGLVVLSPLVGGRTTGIAVMLVGLAGFGVGVGVIYAAALYYAMEVGSAGVDAGGIHETVIGIGYTTGPLCGLAATGLVAAGILEKGRFEITMLGMVSAIAVLVVGIALARAKSAANTAAAGSSRPQGVQGGNSGATGR